MQLRAWKVPRPPARCSRGLGDLLLLCFFSQIPASYTHRCAAPPSRLTSSCIELELGSGVCTPIRHLPLLPPSLAQCSGAWTCACSTTNPAQHNNLAQHSLASPAVMYCQSSHAHHTSVTETTQHASVTKNRTHVDEGFSVAPLHQTVYYSV